MADETTCQLGRVDYRRCAGRNLSGTQTSCGAFGSPTANGFDSYFGDDVPNFPPRAWIEDDRLVTAATEPKPAGMFGSAGPTTPGWDLAAVMPRLAERAVDVISARAAEDRPFFARRRDLHASATNKCGRCGRSVTATICMWLPQILPGSVGTQHKVGQALRGRRRHKVSTAAMKLTVEESFHVHIEARCRLPDFCFFFTYRVSNPGRLAHEARTLPLG